MQKQKQRNIIKLPEGEMINMTFDFDVSSVKGFEQESKYSDTGKRTVYPININKEEVVFASEALYNKLTHYNRGDTVTVGLIDGKWVVSRKNGGETGKGYEDVATMGVLQQILANTEEIKAKLYEEEVKYPKDDEVAF